MYAYSVPLSTTPMHTHRRELPPVTLRGVVSTGQLEPYEMMEMGHEYEDVSKFQQRGVVNSQQRGGISLPEGGGEYEVIENTAVKHVSTAPIDHVRPTQPTDTVPPPPPASQSSQPPPSSQTEDKINSKDEFEFTECIAYETHTHAPPTATPTEGVPLYSNWLFTYLMCQLYTTICHWPTYLTYSIRETL